MKIKSKYYKKLHIVEKFHQNEGYCRTSEAIEMIVMKNRHMKYWNDTREIEKENEKNPIGQWLSGIKKICGLK